MSENWWDIIKKSIDDIDCENPEGKFREYAPLANEEDEEQDLGHAPVCHIGCGREHHYISPLHCIDCNDLFKNVRNYRRSRDMPFLCETCAEYRKGGY